MSFFSNLKLLSFNIDYMIYWERDEMWEDVYDDHPTESALSSLFGWGGSTHDEFFY